MISAILPQTCTLCSVSTPELLCPACARDLPRIPTEHCPQCALPTQDSSLCGQCLAHPPAYNASYAVLNYIFPVDRLIHALKYQGQLAFAVWCAELIAERIALAPRPDYLVAMPLAAPRQRERGFNQAIEIARYLSRRIKIPLLKHAVQRIKHTPPQADLPWKERAKNIRGAFVCGADLTGKSLALVDDVMTTGASLNELAKTLKRSGAVRVENWVVARTLRTGML